MSENQDKKNPFKKPPILGDNQNARFGKNLFLWLLIFASVVGIYMMFNSVQRPEWPIPYNKYLELLNEGYIKSAVITKSHLNDFEFHGELKEPISLNVEGRIRQVRHFVTKLGVIDSKTEELWISKGIEIKYESANNPFWNTILSLLPWIVLIAIYIFFLRRMQIGSGGSSNRNIFSFGKSRARLISNSQNRVTFQDVAGCDEAKEELQEIVEFLKDPQKFQRLGGRIPRGVLLIGPPGSGKTLLARAIAGEANVPFFSISGAEFVEMFVGVGASRVRDLFEQAKKNAPCIVFIDEIDAVGRQRGAGLGGGHDEREQTLNQLLVEMDGFEQNSSLIVIAATNRPDVLDPALLRPGRFDRQVVVDRPDVRGREAIFKVHSRKLPLSEDVDFEVLAKATPGLSGADIANIVNEAALLAARRNSDVVTMYDFEVAKDKVLMGIERKSLVISEKEKEITAYHEMGHALVAKFTPNADPVHKVTIIPRGRALGVTATLPKEDFHTLSKEYLIAQLVVLMAGRAAEKVVFNSLSTGAANDLERATNIARKMVCDWGMSEELGPVTFANKHEEVFLGREIAQPRDHSEATALIIDKEVRKILVDAYEKAESLLREKNELLHKTARVLLERETLEGEELDMLIRGEELPPISITKLRALKSLKLNGGSEQKQNSGTVSSISPTEN
ncbi:MAG: ATP-dependent zinc metalloprotease FtsH [Ignavibacteria bacterium]|nr:ATP-dependent zinc metalloprotease FtsH [Ignavibacteria bacterium]